MGEYDYLENLPLAEYEYLYAGITGKHWYSVAEKTPDKIRNDAIRRLHLSGPEPLPVIAQNLQRLRREQHLSQSRSQQTLNHHQSTRQAK